MLLQTIHYDREFCNQMDASVGLDRETWRAVVESPSFAAYNEAVCADWPRWARTADLTLDQWCDAYYSYFLYDQAPNSPEGQAAYDNGGFAFEWDPEPSPRWPVHDLDEDVFWGYPSGSISFLKQPGALSTAKNKLVLKQVLRHILGNTKPCNGGPRFSFGATRETSGNWSLGLRIDEDHLRKLIDEAGEHPNLVPIFGVLWALGWITPARYGKTSLQFYLTVPTRLEKFLPTMPVEDSNTAHILEKMDQRHADYESVCTELSSLDAQTKMDAFDYLPLHFRVDAVHEGTVLNKIYGGPPSWQEGYNFLPRIEAKLPEALTSSEVVSWPAHEEWPTPRYQPQSQEDRDLLAFVKHKRPAVHAAYLQARENSK